LLPEESTRVDYGGAYFRIYLIRLYRLVLAAMTRQGKPLRLKSTWLARSAYSQATKSCLLQADLHASLQARIYLGKSPSPAPSPASKPRTRPGADILCQSASLASPAVFTCLHYTRRTRLRVSTPPDSSLALPISACGVFRCAVHQLPDRCDVSKAAKR
jgi:hypothetical protein